MQCGLCTRSRGRGGNSRQRDKEAHENGHQAQFAALRKLQAKQAQRGCINHGLAERRGQWTGQKAAWQRTLSSMSRHTTAQRGQS
eukprot:1159521-Pelagomonas_calceolata.AAC.5